MSTTHVFDGHNDLLLRLLRSEVTADGVATGLEDGHIDLPRATEGGFAGGFFAIYVPSAYGTEMDRSEVRDAEMRKPSYALPLPPPLAEEIAADWAGRGFAALEDLETAGAIRLCRTADEIEETFGTGRMAAVAHIEGAEAIDRDFARLHEYHAQGLRSVGPVWSRDTVWGYGVPFEFPASPDTGPGLTDAGKALVRECNALNMVIDLSHLNEKGFDDFAAISTAPLVASHSNAWSITPHSRNLTDRQLEIIRDSDGIVGINFASAFLRPDGRMDDDFGLDIVLRHFDHLVEILGEDRVGLGSDFDGALVPKPLHDCAGLPKLMAALRDHGVDEPMVTKLAHGNWLRVLRNTWGD